MYLMGILFSLLVSCVSGIRYFGKDIEVGTTLLHLKNIGLQYGYPLDAFGGMFPTFSVKTTEDPCDTAINSVWELNGKKWRCKYAIAIVHGTYGASRFIARQKSLNFGGIVGEDYSTNESLPASWTNDIYKIGKILLPSYLQHDLIQERTHSRVSGLLTPDRLRDIINVLHKCVSILAGKIIPLKMRPFACGFDTFLNILFDKLDFGEEEKVLVPPVDNRTLSALYWLLFCKHAWSNVIRRLGVDGVKYNYHPSCPNPCARYHGNPCLDKPNVFQLAQGLLDRTDERQDRFFGAQICRHFTDPFDAPGYAALSNQAYECICKKGYRWSNQTRSCVLINGCKEHSACDPRGTRVCVSTVSTIAGVNTLPFTCLCHPGYMGPRCEKKRDACIENENPEQMSGNQACRVFLGNICEPRIGTNFYSCQCNGLFTSDKSVTFPNCFKRRPICSTVICNRGDCVASKDQLNYICLCQLGWRGRHCEIPDIRMWLPWEGWSGCSAAICTGLGWRHRIRHCRANVTKLKEEGVDKGLCDGEDVQRQLCKATCPTPISSYVLCLKIIVVFALGCVILVGAVGALYLRVKVEV